VSDDLDKYFEDELAKSRSAPALAKKAGSRKYACTVINLLPFELPEEKPMMLPSVFRVPEARFEGNKLVKLGILHVEEGVHYVPNPLVDEGRPGSSIRQITPPTEMARSICEDYTSAHIETSETAQPGLFWVEGRLTEKDLIEEYPDLISDRLRMQFNWFRRLCALADADFKKNRNMLSVSDLQRSAAKILGVRAEWVEMQMSEYVVCKFCTTQIPTFAIKCPNCKEIVDKEAYDKLVKSGV